MKTLNRKKNQALILILILIVVMLPVTAIAQSKGTRLGILFGAGKAKVDNENFLNQSGKLVLGGGFGISYQLAKNFGMYGNVLFTSKGTKSTGTEMSTGQIHYSYWKGLSFYAIEIPVMPKLSIRLNRFYLKAFAGPSINFNIHTNEEKVYDNSLYNEVHGYKDQKVDVPLLEYAIVWGGGIDAEVSGKDILFVEFRKQEDLNMNAINIVNNNHYYNEYYLISIGYLYKY